MPRDHTQERQERAHQRVWELLPWHLTARLEPAESRLVESHLAECGRCREELARSQALAKALHEDAEGVPSPHPGGFARLLARVDALQTMPARLTRRARTAQLLRTTPRPVRRLVAGQFAALLLLALAFAWWAGPRTGTVTPAPAVFRTLSSGDGAIPSGLVLRVVFAPEATESEIRLLLAATGGQIAGGPSPMGAYLIKLLSPSAEPLSLVLAHLRSHPKVRFAEPVAGTAPLADGADGGSGN